MAENYIKGMPANIEAERSILGAVLLENDLCDQLESMLKREDFFLSSHRILRDAMVDLRKENKIIDLITLGEKLGDEFERVGGATYIASLIDAVPRTDTIEHYTDIVKDKAIKRALITFSNKTITNCFDDEDLKFIISQADKELYDIVQGQEHGKIEHASEPGRRVLVKMRKLAQSGKLPGLSTGYYDLDAMTLGLHGLTILAARTSHGKSALAKNIAKNVVYDDGTVLVFTMEVENEEYMQGFYAADASIDTQRLRRAFLSETEWERLHKSVARLDSVKLFVDDSTGLNTAEMRVKARRMKADPKTRLDLIIIDYLNLMDSTDKKQQRHLEVGQITRDLKILSKELRIPVLALAQLSRSVDSRDDHDPILADLRESGNIEQDADCVMFIVNDYIYTKAYEDAGKARCIIAKQRNGPTGEVKLTWLREFTRFENYQLGEPE